MLRNVILHKHTQIYTQIYIFFFNLLHNDTFVFQFYRIKLLNQGTNNLPNVTQHNKWESISD